MKANLHLVIKIKTRGW